MTDDVFVTKKEGLSLRRLLLWGAIGIFALMVIILVMVGAITLSTAFFSDRSGAQVVPEPQGAVMTTPDEEPGKAESVSVPNVFVNDLVSPILHHADSHAPEEGYGSFDIGVNEGQIGLVFGWHVRWLQGGANTAKVESCLLPQDIMEDFEDFKKRTGCGCGLVILTPGWYENLEVLDGRYEVYDVPSSDYLGWVEVLGEQRADEQEAHYGCPGKLFTDLPQWESSSPSP